MNMEELKIERVAVGITEIELNRKRVRLIAILLEIDVHLRAQQVQFLALVANSRRETLELKEAA